MPLKITIIKTKGNFEKEEVEQKGVIKKREKRGK